jgi:hypothetical protein
MKRKNKKIAKKENMVQKEKNLRMDRTLPLTKKEVKNKSNRINNIGYLWDELKEILENDTDFKIEEVKEDHMVIKSLRSESFHNSYIMGKIIGKILPFDCTLELKINNKLAEKPINDQIVYDIDIRTNDNLYYTGRIDIVR